MDGCVSSPTANRSTGSTADMIVFSGTLPDCMSAVLARLAAAAEGRPTSEADFRAAMISLIGTYAAASGGESATGDALRQFRTGVAEGVRRAGGELAAYVGRTINQAHRV